MQPEFLCISAERQPGVDAGLEDEDEGLPDLLRLGRLPVHPGEFLMLWFQLPWQQLHRVFCSSVETLVKVLRLPVFFFHSAVFFNLVLGV